MEIKEGKDIDKEIVLLRRKYKRELGQQKKADIKTEKVTVFDYIIELPAGLEDMNETIKKAIYLSKDRPPVIKINNTHDITFTFSKAEISEKPYGKDIQDYIKTALKKSRAAIVLYDSGVLEAGGLTVYWLDYKVNCLNGNLYDLLYIFSIGNSYFIGNFQCRFEKYDEWKAFILESLKTMKRRSDE